MNSTYPDHGGESNICIDDSVSIRRLSQSYVGNNYLVRVSLRFSPRSDRDQGFLNTRVMSWMTSRIKLSNDIDHASTMSWMTSQQILSDDVVSCFNIKSLVLRRDFSATCLKTCYRQRNTSCSKSATKDI